MEPEREASLSQADRKSDDESASYNSDADELASPDNDLLDDLYGELWTDGPLVDPSPIQHALQPPDILSAHNLTAYYPSRPLQPGTREIRLLHLFADDFHESIRVSMSIHDLDAALIYEALSYTWGPPASEKYVLNGNNRIMVTDNLFYALRRLRYPDQDRILWVDALCINQLSVEERSQQIGVMRDIYQLASKVIIWLGDTDAMPDDLSYEPEIITADFLAHQSKRATIGRAFGEALARTQPKWWHRVWTVQEFVVPSVEPWICFEQYTISIDILFRLELPGSSLTKELLASIDILRQFRILFGDGHSTLKRALQLTQSRQATLPGDRIFGILSLLPPDMARELKLGLVEPTAVRSARLTLLYMEEVGTCAILPFPIHWSSRPRLHEPVDLSDKSTAPTWAIDFASVTAVSYCLDNDPEILDTRTSFANDHRKYQDYPPPAPAAPPKINDLSSALVCSVRTYGAVEAITEVSTEYTELRTVPREIWRAILRALAISKKKVDPVRDLGEYFAGSLSVDHDLLDKWIAYDEEATPIDAPTHRAVVTTSRFEVGVALNLVREGDVIVTMEPGSKTVLLAPHGCPDGVIRYLFKGFVYMFCNLFDTRQAGYEAQVIQII
ncbi:hypothetical protein LTR86_006006 [Recurvomyces mirabilis]|nr:hypothetical protein LTR86_006006 [Recurvomyces mirabilis]